MASQSMACWVWCPVESSKAAQFRHPAEVPLEDAAAAKAAFMESLRGPRVARISPATMLQAKGASALIAEKGATREVPKYMVLPWYEGLLLLEALEARQGQPGFIPATWLDGELREVLEKERAKFHNGRLNGTLYCEKRLLTVAVTGSRFVDGDREWQFRREKMRPGDAAALVEGENAAGFFRVKAVMDYLPPWDAFQHEKCGFYQDFYQVQWSYPFSEVDYTAVENGSDTGATWEPDECLPTDLDSLRVLAKKTWIKKRRELEAKMEAVKKQATPPPQPSPLPGSAGPPSASPPPNLVIKRERSMDEGSTPRPPAKMAKTKRDGGQLDRDLLSSKVGHDFQPDGVEEKLGKIRNGWPKQAQDYPQGFAVASPPGFCWANCDCMDDMRPQRSWEMRKGWLDDPSRATAANAAISKFSEQTHFVFRRGSVSKRCYFETDQRKHLDLTCARAALDLAQHTERALNAVLQRIPAAALAPDGDPVRVPARAFLTDEADYDPLRFGAALSDGGALPDWLLVDADLGRLVAVRPPAEADLPLQLRVELMHSEGRVASAVCTIIAENPSATQPWLAATASIVQRFDPRKCPLERGVRAALVERFSEVYDFGKNAAHPRSLGAWLEVMSRILKLLRSASGAYLEFGPKGR